MKESDKKVTFPKIQPRCSKCGHQGEPAKSNGRCAHHQARKAVRAAVLATIAAVYVLAAAGCNRDTKPFIYEDPCKPCGAQDGYCPQECRK